MSVFRPTSYERPGNQISKTPSGKEISSAMNLMIESMVKMIQRSEITSIDNKLEEGFNEY